MDMELFAHSPLGLCCGVSDYGGRERHLVKNLLTSSSATKLLKYFQLLITTMYKDNSKWYAFCCVDGLYCRLLVLLTINGTRDQPVYGVLPASE